MSDAFIEEFLAGFEHCYFPENFLENYEVMECLSHNELGETYLIRDKKAGEYRVAKCFFKNMNISHFVNSSQFREKNHEGLPVFIGAYENDNLLCVVRTYIQGRTLDQYIQEYQLDRERVVSIALQICDVLAFLHHQDPPIIHRDIKPQNIIVNDNGRITLIDFGISRLHKKDSIEDTVCLGTRNYAAPEQYGFSQTDCRSDIYSFGVLLNWLLTGNDDLKNAKMNVGNHWLKKIVLKCTAFDPKDRFQKVSQIKNALRGQARIRQICLFLCLFILFLSGIFLVDGRYFQTDELSGITFSEPLLEEAVRLQLDKDSTEILTEQDLLLIDEIFIFGDKAALNRDIYETYVNSFAANDGSIHRGSIHVLDDLLVLTNLRQVSLGYQNITDLTPLSNLQYMESVDFRNNPVEDISPLSSVLSINILVLFDTKVSDLTALQNCSRLSVLDIGFTSIEAVSALEGLESLQVLNIRKTPLKSLDNIEMLQMLEQLSISETQLQDLSPLLDLPRLQSVVISENMRSLTGSIEKDANFTIIYQ